MTSKNGNAHLQAAFSAADAKLFFTKNDSNDQRLGDFVKPLDDLHLLTHEPDNYVIAGYPDDEGIRINGGRPGSACAPDEVRRYFYKMTPQLFTEKATTPKLWDVGNLKVADFEIQDRHEQASTTALLALTQGARWLSLGGGHDYGFADGKAFCEWCKTQGTTRPLVINFDAHLDVRPTTNGLSSGTPFFRLLEAYPDIDFAEIGIQSQCNSRTHYEWAKKRGARILTQEEIETSDEPMFTHVVRLLGDWILRPRPVFLSIDIDGFSNAVAPGASQSWATGFLPKDFFQVFNLLRLRLDVRLLGIYEVSPPLDLDAQTAKLAAQIMHRLIG